MTDAPKRATKRVRQQTAVLLSAIALQVKLDRKRLYPIPFEEISTDPILLEVHKNIQYNTHLLEATTDHYGAPIIDKKKTRSQGTRLIKAGCPSCGYTIRLSAMWIATGLPRCPNSECDRKGEPFEVAEEFRDTQPETFDPVLTFKQEPAPQPVSSFSPEFQKILDDENDSWLKSKGNDHAKR